MASRILTPQQPEHMLISQAVMGILENFKVDCRQNAGEVARILRSGKAVIGSAVVQMPPKVIGAEPEEVEFTFELKMGPATPAPAEQAEGVHPRVVEKAADVEKKYGLPPGFLAGDRPPQTPATEEEKELARQAITDAVTAAPKEIKRLAEELLEGKNYDAVTKRSVLERIRDKADGMIDVIEDAEVKADLDAGLDKPRDL